MTNIKNTKNSLTLDIGHLPFRRNGGFTFIETIVAIAVLVVSVVAPLSLASQGLRTARLARDQVIANYLAQEAVEFLRYKRDTNAISGTADWLKGLEDCMDNSSCVVDIPNDEITMCEKACPVLRFNDTGGTYGYSTNKVGWTDTKFTRTVHITESVVDTELVADVTVEWSDVLVNRTYVLKERLFNWQ
jgi:type II secretory pathway pseudopilin PulG